MRFQDDGKYLSEFLSYRIVQCPECTHPLKLTLTTAIHCSKCSYLKINDNTDLGNNLYLFEELKDYIQIRCCGELLWSANFEHLDFIEKYVSSKLRERKPNVNRSLASRLPNWIKDKKNRDDILKAIQKFRDAIPTKTLKELKTNDPTPE